MATTRTNQEPSQSRSQKNAEISGRYWLGLAVILSITFLIFYPSVEYGFVDWDDDVNVTQNHNIQNLTKENVKNIFTGTVVGNYNPLPIFSFALEYHFFGLNPKPFHISNIILHLLCTGLVFLILKKLGMSYFVTFCVALLFGIHPMRVESVVWITERKDVLYSVFYLLATFFYINYVNSRKTVYYVLSLAAFVLSLLSKIQAVSLPLTLLLIDYFVNRRFSLKQIPNKIPFFILSLVTGVAGIILLRKGGVIETDTVLPFIQRFFIGTYSLCVYLVKSLVPFEMSAIYPFPSHLTVVHYLSLPVILLIGYWIWRIKKYRVEIIFGSLIFFFNVLFVLQIVRAGQGFIADRFTYLPYLGLFFLMAFVVDKLAGPNRRSVLIALCALYFLTLGIVTRQRVGVWQNTETLFTDVIRKYPKAAVAHNNMGRYYREQKQYGKAIEFYGKEIEIRPNSYLAYCNRGKVYFDTGDNAKALDDFNKSIELNGAYAESRSNRGAALATRGEFETALTDLNRAIELDPWNETAYLNRSLTYYSMNQYDKAVQDVTAYLKIKPNDPQMINLRGLCNSQMNRDQEALIDFNEAVRLLPSQGIFWQNRSYYFSKTGDTTSALRDIRKARELGVPVDADYIRSLEGVKRD